MSDPKKPFSLWRRLLWILGVPLLASLIVALSLYGYRETRTATELASILDDLDENDRAWRLDGIEAARIELPDKENSAVLCRELVKMLGPTWPDVKIDERFQDIPIGERLDVRRWIILEDEMIRLKTIRKIARGMVDRPKGRHKIEYPFNPTATLLNDQQDTRKVAQLFTYEMRYQANKGDISEAVRACRACVCAGRSMYDEPTLISALIRIAIVSVGLNGVERSLALGESNDAELAAMDKLLADEERHNTMLVGVRGERAMRYQLYSRIIAGEIPVMDFSSDFNMEERSSFDKLLTSDRQVLRRQFPRLMIALNRAVEIAELPSHEQEAAENAFGDEVERTRDVVAFQVTPMFRVGAACRRKTAQVAAMRGLIAVERFRMKHGKWPAKLSEVVPEFLDRLPTDPFDGTPIKMVRTSDGIIVYTVGNDKVDNSGKLNRKSPMAAGSDLGFQLWDTKMRAKPASPVAPEEKDP